MKIGVLSNPLSRRNQRDLRVVGKFLAAREDVVHQEIVEFGSLKNILNEFAVAGVKLLVINAGDGTVSAVLTEIYEHGVFPDIPLLAVLPGGTSNTIAGDVGLAGDRIKSLQRLLAVVERGEVERQCVTRQLIRVHYDPKRSAVFGMFFGAAAICDAIALRHRMFPQQWIADPVAGALTLGYVLASVLCGRGGVLRGHTIAVDLGSDPEPEASFSLVMVSTLNRIFLGSAPFWGDGDGSLKFTSIRSPAKGLVRHAYQILYGRDKKRLPRAIYRSASVDQIALKMRCSFTVDGEIFQPSPDTAVILTGPSTARFVQC